jgi:hypothetical protein
MAKNKLSLVRETLLPLSSDDLSQVGGGAITDAVRSKGQGLITGTLTQVSQTCFPQPRPTSAITSGTVSRISRRVSGASNAF